MKLYKYTSLDSAIKIIESGKIIYNCPLNFNDPLDSKPYFSKQDLENIKIFLGNILILKGFKEKERFFPFFQEMNSILMKMNRNKKMSFMNAILLSQYLRERNRLINSKIDLFSFISDEIVYSKSFLKELLEMVQNELSIDFINNKLLKNFYVLCLSDKEDEILMWSHYGDQHKGVCLEFDEIPDNELFKILYTEKRPSFNFQEIASFIESYSLKTIPHNELKSLIYEKYKFFYTKSEKWSYEREYRIFKYDFSHKNNEQRIFLNCPNITKVYLGCNFLKNSDEKVNEFLSLLKAKEIPYIKFKESSYTFELKIDKSFKL